MQASSSIEAEIRGWARAFEEKDVSVLDAFSKQPGAIAVGTDPQEWWSGHERFVAAGKAQLNEMPELSFEVKRVVANEEGSVGWGIADAAVTFSGMEPLPCRLTVVCHREDGAWKAVLWELAFTVPNEQIFSGRLTV